jgi:hypothetical protein
MTRNRIAIFLLSLMPIYVLPVYSMHVCAGQEHHHGNCDGNMHEGSKAESGDAPYQLKKAKHLDCFQLKKANNRCLGCKLNIPTQQLAILVAVFTGQPLEQGSAYQQEYHPPPNKEPPPGHYRIRPPPFTGV